MQELRPFGLGGLDIAEHAVVLCSRDDGAHGRGRIGRNARPEMANADFDALEHSGVDRVDG